MSRSNNQYNNRNFPEADLADGFINNKSKNHNDSSNFGSQSSSAPWLSSSAPTGTSNTNDPNQVRREIRDAMAMSPTSPTTPALPDPRRRRSLSKNNRGNNKALDPSTPITPTARRNRLSRNASSRRNDERHNEVFAATLKRQKKKKAEPTGPPVTWWVIASRILTCCLPTFFLVRIGKTDSYVQQAYREKVALCIIIFFMMLIVGFLTFGFQTTVCRPRFPIQFTDVGDKIFIHGQAWKVSGSTPHPLVHGQDVNSLLNASPGTDVSAMFPPLPSTSACSSLNLPTFPSFPCTATNLLSGQTIWPVE